MQRIITFVLVLFTVLFAACTGGKKPANTAEPTSAATSTPSAQSTGDFQLVGRAQHAFVGVGPGIDLSTASTSDLSATETPGASVTPLASGSFGTPSQGGVMRVLLDDASDSLKSNCSAQRDGRINVFWTTSTQFDQNLLTDNLESSLEGRTVGVVGRIFTASDTNLNQTIGEATASPSESASATESPNATPNPSCILIADQIGTSSGTIPTPFVRRTARTAAPVATASPTPVPTTSPTPVPTATATPAATTVSPSTTP